MRHTLSTDAAQASGIGHQLCIHTTRHGAMLSEVPVGVAFGFTVRHWAADIHNSRGTSVGCLVCPSLVCPIRLPECRCALVRAINQVTGCEQAANIVNHTGASHIRQAYAQSNCVLESTGPVLDLYSTVLDSYFGTRWVLSAPHYTSTTLRISVVPPLWYNMIRVPYSQCIPTKLVFDGRYMFIVRASRLALQEP